jgi:hypothetical protein
MLPTHSKPHPVKAAVVVQGTRERQTQDGQLIVVVFDILGARDHATMAPIK